jgi:cell division protein FtsW
MLRWLRLGAPALLFAALAALALLQVDDYSPLILLLVWGMAMALAWSVAARHKALGLSLAGAGLLAVCAIAWLRIAGGPESAQWGFYADRFAVWLDPASHPHTGQQLLLAARAVAQGAWWGADNWLGLGALGQAAGSVLHIPAVQDDFAPTFFIHRHGLLGALMLWVLQALFLAGLLHTASAAFAASVRARDFRQAWAWRFRCFVLCGGAAFVLGHLLLSWGTNLAIFPIMGQPMSFLSAGGSHLLFFICPLLAFDAASAQSLEENPSCRSTSNTKSWAR